MGNTKVTDDLEWLANWYTHQCDGDWEHQNGVSIDTLDNPGWLTRIDLEGTELDGLVLVLHVVERDTNNWIRIWTESNQFMAACGPLNLGEAIGRFREQVRSVHEKRSTKAYPTSIR